MIYLSLQEPICRAILQVITYNETQGLEVRVRLHLKMYVDNNSVGQSLEENLKKSRQPCLKSMFDDKYVRRYYIREQNTPMTIYAARWSKLCVHK